MKIISTCKHSNYEEESSYTTYDITGFWMRKFHPHDKYYPTLEPKYSFWQIWKQNSQNFSEEENDKYYVLQYYEQILSQLDPEQVYNEIGVNEEIGGAILFCDDDITRFIIGAWFELLIEKKVKDCYIGKELGKFDFKDYDAYGIYAQKIKTYLEEIMRKKYGLKDFQSLRGNYLLMKANKLEQIAKELGENHKDYTSYMQYAYYLSSHAHIIDVEYDKSLQKKMTP